ncbi:MAG: tetratricopeptide repeat protein [bacterium]
MNRGVILLASVFFALLVGIAFLKFRTSKDGSQTGQGGLPDARKETIQQFWQVYRRATRGRIVGDLPSAAADYRRALDLNGKHEDALYYLGNIYLELGKVDSAEQTWKRLEEINPNSARVHFQLGNLYLDFEEPDFFDIDAAGAEFHRALEINKEESKPVLSLGLIALIRGDLHQARDYFEAVVASNFKSVPAYAFDGYVAWKEGNSQRALTLFRKAVEYSVQTHPVQGVLGKGETRSGKSLARSHRHTLFQACFGDLAGLEPSAFSHEMAARYRKLGALLDRIRTKYRL